MFFKIFVISLFLAFINAAERGSPCTTPRGETVTCVSIFYCSGLLNLLLTKIPSNVEFAKKSQCGFDTEPLVCCGFSDYSPDFFEVFTKKPEDAEDSITAMPQMPMLSIADVLPNTTECGWEKESNEILPEAMTDFVEFPWLAALEYKNKHTGENVGIRCTGTIINKRFIVTAAQCLVDPNFEVSHVWLGDWKFSTDPDCRKKETNVKCADKILKVQVEEKLPHPFYNETIASNDVGLLRLKTDISYTDYIRPICMPTPQYVIPQPGAYLYAAGWGATKCGHASDMKLKKSLRLLSNSHCKQDFQERQISVNEMCMVNEKENESYQGDSGGPLMKLYRDEETKQNRWYLEGVGSWGGKCGVSGNPVIYARVSRFVQWILNNLLED